MTAAEGINRKAGRFFCLKRTLGVVEKIDPSRFPGFLFNLKRPRRTRRYRVRATWGGIFARRRSPKMRALSSGARKGFVT
jgi:hypothetical protein